MSNPCTRSNPFEDGSAAASLRGLPSFEEALARLLHTAEHGRPFDLVQGPSGCGKSLLLEQVAHELRQTGQECGQVDLQRSSAEEFPRQLAGELGVVPVVAAEVWRQVEDAIVGRALAGRPIVLLLDHLDTIDAPLRRCVERLLAIARGSAGWCSVLSAGRSSSPVVQELARQHGELRIELCGLSLDETNEFLRQVSATNGSAPFTDEAAAALHRYTGGLVREILSLGRLGLFACAADEVSEVTAERITMVAGETFQGDHRHRSLPGRDASGRRADRLTGAAPAITAGVPTGSDV